VSEFGHTLEEIVGVIESMAPEKPAIWVRASNQVQFDSILLVAGANAAQELGLDPLTCARHPNLRTIICPTEEMIEKIEDAAREAGVLLLPEEEGPS